MRGVGKLSKDGQILAFSFGKGKDVGWLVVLDDLTLTWLNL